MKSMSILASEYLEKHDPDSLLDEVAIALDEHGYISLAESLKDLVDEFLNNPEMDTVLNDRE